MNMDDWEAELVRAARRGDRQAFGGLVERHWNRLVRLARSVVGETDAEDVVQEGLIAAWRKLGSLREPGAFPRWLSTIVLRICFRRARREWSVVSLQEVPEMSSVESSAEAAIDMERLLRALAPQQRAVMHLTVVEGMTDAEIGSILEVRAATVRAHRRRARESLSRIWNRWRDGTGQENRSWMTSRKIL